MERSSVVLAVGCLILVSIGCCSPPEEPVIDREAALAAIRQADIDFDEALSERDLERFKGLIASDAAFYEASGIVVGPEAVVETWLVFFDPDSGVTLRWAPQEADVSADATLGFTRGEWQMTRPGEDGEPVTGAGWYVTIWRKNAEGRWQATVDIGNPKNS